MSERQARCICGSTVPSSDKLAFFEFRGEGSKHATEICKCGYNITAHHVQHIAAHCQDATPRGPHEFDGYYCGCRGWD